MYKRFARAVHLHRFLVAFSLVYIFSILAIIVALGGRLQDTLSFVSETALGFAASSMFFMVIMFFYLIRALKTTPLGPRWFTDVMKRFEDSTAAYLTGERFMNAVLALLIASPMTVFFCIGKGFIPLHGYTIDPALAAADRWLHLGRYPHEYIVPLVEKYNLSKTADMFYLTWFPILYLVCQFCFVADWNQYRRMRFLWTFCLTWLIAGTIMAYLLASVGPYFFQFFYPCLHDPYMSLVEYLQAQNRLHPMDLFKVGHLEMDLTRSPDIVKLNALSAMPSMHIGMAVLFFLYATSVNRWLAVLFFLPYAVLIAFCSVYLGWHYAVDGYVVTLVTTLIWLASGPLVRRLHPELAALEDA